MTDDSQAKQARPEPADVPPAPPESLAALGVLVGEWALDGSHVLLPDTPLRGTARFEWLSGERFLIQRVTNEPPEVPDSISVIGAGDSGESLAMHYFDSRGVSRLYQMRLDGPVWTLWREAPGFWQRFSGTLSDDAQTIRGTWEVSRDGVEWQRDLDQTYTRRE